MGHAIPVRPDYSASEVRQFAKRAKDAAQARRLLAIAAVLDGASREDAAKIGGMDRQTLRDWVIRFNEHRAADSVPDSSALTTWCVRSFQGMARKPNVSANSDESSSELAGRRAGRA